MLEPQLVKNANFEMLFIQIFSLVFFFKDFIYLFMRDIEKERGRDIGRGRSRLLSGSPMWDSIPDPQIML